MDKAQLRTIEQIEQFLKASSEVAFTAHSGDVERSAARQTMVVALRRAWHQLGETGTPSNPKLL